MLLELSEDQEFFRETTARFLDEFASISAVRALRRDPIGYEADYWRRGADLGWTSLLVDEAHGGGSISGAGLVDLTLVAYEFGRRAAPGPLLPINLVAALLSRSSAHEDIVASLIAGTATAAWCLNEPAPHNTLGAVGLEARIDGDEIVLHGVKKPVESAGPATVLLVTARTGDGLTNVLVPADSPGITITPMKGVELTRRYAKVEFDHVRVPLGAAVGSVGGAEDEVAWAIDAAAVLTAQESVGAMQSALDMSVEWAFDRYSFGRPLASYQALKHRYADMKVWLEAGHAVADAAAIAVANGEHDASRQASAASSFVHHFGSELMHECVQMHGGIGVTYEHDLHLYMRRLVANRATYGTPQEHRRRIGDLLLLEEAA